ncbi:DUF2510 domain-containing protein [Cellulomonas sp. KRMCY2]|uniref:DUF2510 domain-containing protein n=1 Tax=Cellulomonas sp. KRMCY2 TaxID=1304865 RepID=UPI00045E9365|nr:DUF2510 domain-containing protein [Cellulomonas sp. KRMCY2]
MSPQAGWYAAPGEPGMTRFWDGQRWTEYRQSLPSTGPPGTPALELLSKLTTAQQYLGSEPVRATGIAVRMIVVGVAVLLFSAFITRTMHWDDGRVGAGEVTVQGTVVAQNRHLSAKGLWRCAPDVAYEVDGSSYVAGSSGSSSDCPAVGDSARVVYPATDPAAGRVAPSSTTTLLAAVLPAAGILSLVGGIGTFVWRVLPVGASVRRFVRGLVGRERIEGAR